MAKTTITGRRLKAPPLNRFHKRDSIPLKPINLTVSLPQSLKRQLKLSPEVLRRIDRLNKTQATWSMADIAGSTRLSRRDYEQIGRRTLWPSGTHLTIVDMQPRNNRIMSDRPFTLEVEFAYCGDTRPEFIAIVIEWAGKTFVREKMLTNKEAESGRVEVRFGREQSLPPGPSVFRASLFARDGRQARFRTTCMVLPSNPLTMHLAPRIDYVTGSYSARGVRESGNVFKTRISITISNGDSTSASINRAMSWAFWDGGVGGTLVESGTYTWGSSITVPAYGTWTGNITVNSPSGSGIHGRYNSKEDMTIDIGFTASDGRSINDTITARVMVGFGMNITRVGAESFTSTEYSDLYDAVDVTQEIYEARDVTYTGISRRHITDANAGSYTIINSLNEGYNLFNDWSGPNNNYIDVFIVHDHTTGFDGLAGDVPGPTSHAGSRSGVWADKTGTVDSLGNARLDIDYLGMLIGHEVGHYLGLPHVTLANNLLLSNSGRNDTDLTYDQYRLIIGYGWAYVA